MTKQEFVKQYVENNPTPDQNMCPDVILRYKGNAEKYGGAYITYYRPKTGQKFINANPFAEKKVALYSQYEGEKYLMISPGSLINSMYVKHIQDNIHGYNMVEFATVTMNNGRPDRKLNADKRAWEYAKYTDRVFLFKDSTQPYDENGNELWLDKKGKFYNHNMVRYLNCFKYTNIVGVASYQLREFAYDKGIYDPAEGKVNLNYYWHISEYYKHMIPRQQSTVTKKKIEIGNISSLNSFEDIEKQYKMYITKTEEVRTGYGGSYTADTTYVPIFFWSIEQDKEKNTYFRLFERELLGIDISSMKSRMSVNSTQIIPYKIKKEFTRIVITPKNKVTVYKLNNFNDTFEISGSGIENASRYKYGKIENLEKIKDIDNLKQYYDTLKNKPARYQLSLLVQSLRHPIYQNFQLSKYKNLARAIDTSSINSSISELFYTSSKSNDINKTTGLNDYQLELLEELAEGKEDMWGYINYTNKHWIYIAKQFKLLLNNVDVSTLSDEKSKYYISNISQILEQLGGLSLHTLFKNSPGWLYARESYAYTDEDRAIFDKLCVNQQKDPLYVKKLSEAMYTYKTLKTEYIPKTIIFSYDLDVSALIDFHTMCVENRKRQYAGVAPLY